MILFTVLLITVLIMCILGVIIALTVGVGGIGFILTFGDVILCVLLIVWIIRHFIKKHKEKKGN